MDISQDEQRQLIAAGARMQEAEEALFDLGFASHGKGTQDPDYGCG